MKPYLYLFFLITVAVFSGCSEEKKEKKENIVVVHLNGEPESLHPTNYNSGYAQFLFDYTQRQLQWINKRSLQVEPSLIVSNPEISGDRLSYTFELRDDVKWDDGSPLTVDDVIFTTKISKCPLTDNPSIRSHYRRMESIEKDPDNPRKFTLHCNEKYFANPIIYNTRFYIMQKSRWDSADVFGKYSLSDFNDPDFDASADSNLVEYMKWYNSSENGRNPENLTGLGPYRITGWDVGNSIVLEKKENWWGDKDTSFFNDNNPDKIIFKIINDDAGLSLALKKQTVDVTTYIATIEMENLKKNEDFNKNYFSTYEDRFGYSYIGLNMRPDGFENKPLFTDARVRRAMAYLVDVQEIANTVAMGKITRQISNVSPLKEEHNDTLKPIEFNLEKARKLLDEAGWKDRDGDNIREKTINGEVVPFKFQLNYVTHPAIKDLVLMIKENMYKAGVEITPNPMDFSVWIQKALDHNFDALFGSWGGDALPDDPEQLWHTRNWVNKGYNIVGFGNAHSDSLIEVANKTLDPEKRKKIMHEIQAIIYEEQPYIFLYATKRKIIINNKFGNKEVFVASPGILLNMLTLKDEENSED